MWLSRFKRLCCEVCIFVLLSWPSLWSHPLTSRECLPSPSQCRWLNCYSPPSAATTCKVKTYRDSCTVDVILGSMHARILQRMKTISIHLMKNGQQHVR